MAEKAYICVCVCVLHECLSDPIALIAAPVVVIAVVGVVVLCTCFGTHTMHSFHNVEPFELNCASTLCIVVASANCHFLL
eukprot:m.348891 g.348891  ORF g.348891 m.348891 type:complete len:80 (-) comp16148_c1_seq17:2662-2901(-)